MLILTRRVGQAVVINRNIKVVILAANEHQVRLGIEAPKDIPVYREEIEKLITESTNES